MSISAAAAIVGAREARRRAALRFATELDVSFLSSDKFRSGVTVSRHRFTSSEACIIDRHVEHSSAHTERLTGHLRGFAPPLSDLCVPYGRVFHTTVLDGSGLRLLPY